MKRFILCTSLTLLPACDSNVDADYKGEPLISLNGQVNKPDVTPQGDIDVVLAWVNFAVEDDLAITEKAAIDGEFPASFTLDIFNAPAPELLMHFDDGEPGVTIAIVLAVPAGADLENFEYEPQIEGVDENHILAYVESDLPPESYAAWYLGAPLKAGFHLLDVIPADPDAYDACVAENWENPENNCSDLYFFDRMKPAPEGALLNLKLAPLDELDPPNVF